MEWFIFGIIAAVMLLAAELVITRGMTLIVAFISVGFLIAGPIGLLGMFVVYNNEFFRNRKCE